MHEVVKRAKACYDELLASTHRESSLDALSAAKERGLLQHWQRLGGCILRPLFIHEQTYSAACRSATVVARAVLTATRRAMVDEKFRATLGLSEEQEYAVSLDLVEKPEPFVGRLDGFFDDTGELRFLEYNAFPAGIPEMDRFNGVFESLAIVRVLRRHFSVRS